MKRLLLTIIAALTLSMGSTFAFRDATTTPAYGAAEFNALDPMPKHYKTCLTPIDLVTKEKPMVVDSNTTELMQPSKAWGSCVTDSRVWQWGKWAMGLPAAAITWPTTKFLTWTFKAPYVRELLGPQAAAFFGSLVGLTAFYAFNPLGLSAQMLTTLQLLLTINFSMDTFERLCSIVTAMLNHQWKNAAVEFAASVIIGLLIFDVRGIRTTIGNGMVKGANALDNATGNVVSNGANTAATFAKQSINTVDNATGNVISEKMIMLQQLAAQLSTGAAEFANSIADKLCAKIGYNNSFCASRAPVENPTELGQRIAACTQKTGLTTSQCAPTAIREVLAAHPQPTAPVLNEAQQPWINQTPNNAPMQQSVTTVELNLKPIDSVDLTLPKTVVSRPNPVTFSQSCDNVPSNVTPVAYHREVKTVSPPTFWCAGKSDSAICVPRENLPLATQPLVIENPTIDIPAAKPIGRAPRIHVKHVKPVAPQVQVAPQTTPVIDVPAAKPIGRTPRIHVKHVKPVAPQTVRTTPVVTQVPAAVVIQSVATPVNQTVTAVASEQCPVMTATVDNSKALTVYTAPAKTVSPALPRTVLNSNAALNHAEQVQPMVTVADNSKALTVYTAPAKTVSPVLPRTVLNNNSALKHAAQTQPALTMADDSRALIVVSTPAAQTPMPAVIGKCRVAPAVQNPSYSINAPVQTAPTATQCTAPVVTVKAAPATSTLTCSAPEQSFAQSMHECMQETDLSVGNCAGMVSSSFADTHNQCTNFNLGNTCANPAPFNYHPTKGALERLSDFTYKAFNGAREWTTNAFNWFTKTAEDTNTLLVNTASELVG